MKTQIDSKSLYFENVGDKTIYYSYNTTVAIKTPIETYVCENVWSVTTAKHLNRIEELTGSNREYRMNMVSLNWWMFNSNTDWIYIYWNIIISCIFYIGGICFY